MRVALSDLDLGAGVRLGAGAFGQVVTARHVPSGREVAVKRMNVHDARTRDDVKRELECLYAGACPQVLAFYGAFQETATRICLVLELMAGSLADAVNATGPIPLEPLRGIARQAVLGLVHLHRERSIMHRDIKPSNLLFNATGEVKIGDFGASKLQADAAPPGGGVSHIATTFCGTVTFMSPERLAGGRYGAAADVWALGLSLLQCATASHPFRSCEPTEQPGGSTTYWAVLDYIRSHPPPALPVPPFDAGLASFIQACVQLDPSARPGALELLSHPFLAPAAADPVALVRPWAEAVVPRIAAARAAQRDKRTAMYDGIIDDAAMS